MARTELRGAQLKDDTVVLGTDTSGTLPVNEGGTGATTLTGLVKGNGTSAFTAVTAPTGAVVGDTDTQTLTSKRVNPRVVTLTDGATVAVDSNTTDIGILSMGGDRTLLAPSGTPVDGQKLQIRVLASGAGRTLTLTTGSAGSYAFGSDITALTQTASGKYDYLGFIYNSTSQRWQLLAYVKGY